MRGKELLTLWSKFIAAVFVGQCMELTVLSGMIFFIVAVQVASNEHSSIIIKQIIRFFFF